LKLQTSGDEFEEKGCSPLLTTYSAWAKFRITHFNRKSARGPDPTYLLQFVPRPQAYTSDASCRQIFASPRAEFKFYLCGFAEDQIYLNKTEKKKKKKKITAKPRKPLFALLICFFLPLQKLYFRGPSTASKTKEILQLMLLGLLVHLQEKVYQEQAQSIKCMKFLANKTTAVFWIWL